MLRDKIKIASFCSERESTDGRHMLSGGSCPRESMQSVKRNHVGVQIIGSPLPARLRTKACENLSITKIVFTNLAELGELDSAHGEADRGYKLKSEPAASFSPRRNESSEAESAEIR